MVQSDTGLGAREHSERAHNEKKEPYGGAETGRGDFGYAPAYPKAEECSRSEHDEASCRGDDEATLFDQFRISFEEILLGMLYSKKIF